MFFFLIGGPRDPLKKRNSLSDSIMHLIEDRGEMLKHLRNKSERYNVFLKKFSLKLWSFWKGIHLFTIFLQICFFFFAAQVHFKKSRKKKSYFEFMYVKWLKVKFSIGQL